MWKRFLETLWQAFQLAEDTRQNKKDVKALEKSILDLAAASERKFHESQLANERLVHEVQRLNDELKRQRDHEESERRILKLELENYLLRQQRELPSVEPKQLSESATGYLKDDADDGK